MTLVVLSVVHHDEAVVQPGERSECLLGPHRRGRLEVGVVRHEKADRRVGVESAMGTLLEVLISPLQSLELKDQAALIIGELGDMSAIPAMRTYVNKEDTAAGREALVKLEQKVGR